ncbi:hypothetical protein FB451DRAFT_1293110 [Mycena latifolia]|nr:hypothetical protein FB451DRAFT_1293110 [Mycena latifolia]
MPQVHHNTIYRRDSLVKEARRHQDDLENFHHFLRERVDLPAEWSIPDLPWNFDPPRNPPPLAPPVMSRVAPSPELPNLPSDWWHRDTNVKIVGGTGEIWSGDHIPFFPNHGPCTIGISMKLARLGSGILHAQKPLSNFVNPILFNIPHPMLYISFPGYQAIEESGLQPLTLARPLPFHPNVTVAELAKQVADYFFEFSEVYGAHCNPRDPQAILLGPGGVNFNRLRMVKLWKSRRQLHWNLEVAIVDDYV